MARLVQQRLAAAERAAEEARDTAARRERAATDLEVDLRRADDKVCNGM